jgi:Protein of unknown function (DUF1161)
LKSALISLALGWACHAAVGQTCEAIQAQIDTKIRATGTANFNLATVPAESTAAGKLVGTCDRGAKKILYTRVGSVAGASSVAASAVQPNRVKNPTPSPMLTECKDGSMSLGGDCKK